MSTLLDARPYVTAVKVAVKALLGPNDVYDYRQVPGSDGNAGVLPNIYVLVSVERRYNPQLRVSAQAGVTGWRLQTVGVGRTADECRWAMFKTATALNERTLAVGSDVTTPLQLESEDAPQWDDGRFSALARWTFAH